MLHSDKPDEDIPSDTFLVEEHVADAMPLAHWHDHIEINFLPEGQMDYLLSGRRARLRPRRLGIFWAAIHHQAIEVGTNQRLMCAYVPIFDFLALPMRPEFRAAVLRGELVQTAAACPSDEHRLCEMIATWATADGALRQLFRDEMLLRLRRMSFEPHVYSFETAPVDPDQVSRTGTRGIIQVERMAAFINENLIAGISVADVAAHAGVHPTTARASFRKVLGITIGGYIRRQRLSFAMRLLADSDLEIAEVAHQAGYSSVPRLYDAFAQETGKTPRQFRQEIKSSFAS